MSDPTDAPTPASLLTLERPDIWRRGLDLATGLTGYLYLPKLPAADGTIFACGGVYREPLEAPKPKTPEDLRKERITKIDSEIAWRRRLIKERKEDIDLFEREIGDLEKEKATLSAAPSVLVPDGAMEWLLHEVGHWLAASSDERKLPNYGDGREVEAWAFEEIVLGQFGPARHFAPLTQRDGTAFDLSGPIPASAFRHIDRAIAADHVAVEQFKAVWGEWVRWGQSKGARAPWRNEA